jgi:hypothetical protein
MMLRALMNWFGFGRAAAPAVELTIEPTTRRGGRPKTYHQDGPATDAERKRRQYWRAKGKRRREPHETRFRDTHEISPLKKEEEKKEGEPISKNWRPDPDGERLGKEVYGDGFEAAVVDHIDYCLKTDFRCHDHDANWRRRCRYFQRNPQRELDLRPRARQLGVKDGGQAKREESAAERSSTENKVRAFSRLHTAALKNALSAIKSAGDQAAKLAAVRAAGVVFGSHKSQWTAQVWLFAVDETLSKAIEEGLDEEEASAELDEGIRAGEQVAPDTFKLGETTFIGREFIRPAYQKKESSG